MKNNFSLAHTDPELVKLFNDFAFEQALPASGLDQKTAAMVTTAVNLGMNSVGNFKTSVEHGLYLGLTPLEIREIVYQATPFVGFAQVVGFVDAMNAVFTEKGVELPLEKVGTVTRDDAYEKGLEFMKENFGSYIESLNSLDKGDSTDFNHWLVEYAFGDFFTRGVLDPKTRELIAFCILYAMDANRKQTRTHIRVNLRMGNDKDLLINVLKCCTPYVGFPRTFNALNMVNSVYQEELKFSE